MFLIRPQAHLSQLKPNFSDKNKRHRRSPRVLIFIMDQTAISAIGDVADNMVEDDNVAADVADNMAADVADNTWWMTCRLTWLIT